MNGHRFSRIVSSIVVLLAGGCSLAFPATSAAQTETRLTGRFTIGLATGTIAGDVCLSGVPSRGDSITLVLNRRLSIESISGVRADAVSEVAEPGDAATRYTFVGASQRVSDAGPHVADVCLEYSGGFDVHRTDDGDYLEDDASSIVAFDGRRLRARGVSRWYPAPFDPRTALTAEAISFDVEVACEQCRTIYVNGGPPQAGPIAAFHSPDPRELLLVAGELAVESHAGVTFIGPPIPPNAATAFANNIAEISSFLEEFVGLPYGEKPHVISLMSLRAPRRGELWGFLSDPALILMGMSVPELVATMEGSEERAKRSVVTFVAHELAHRYFAWTLGSGSPQRDFFGEPFATYLELKAVRHYFGEEEYVESLDRLRRRESRLQRPKPLNEASADDFAESSYRYVYSPLLLIALENSIGEEAMRKTLASLLNAPAMAREQADYRFLIERALAAGVAERSLKIWEDRCVLPGGTGPTCFDGVTD